MTNKSEEMKKNVGVFFVQNLLSFFYPQIDTKTAKNYLQS